MWVFVGDGARLPSAVFDSLADAELWIGKELLSGMLTAYPVGFSVYDWAVSFGFYKPSPDRPKTPSQIGSFSSAHLEHYHYENGCRRA